MLAKNVCYRAALAKDARFDGRFFVASRSTGVYCRPVCSTRLPKLENCSFFSNTETARDAGYRPCSRCRSDSLPGTPAWNGTAATVTRALRLIDEGALDEGARTEDLAKRLGVGERHLRRLFREHLGVSPAGVARNRRVAVAKRLIEHTSLPMIEVALASGFSSLRRFNASIQKTYGNTPSFIRRSWDADASEEGASIKLSLPFKQPFQGVQIFRYLSERAIPGIEVGSDNFYARTLEWEGVPGTLLVRQEPFKPYLLVTVWHQKTALLPTIVERVRHLFDLHADPKVIAACLGSNPPLSDAVRQMPGLRIPGSWDGFEFAVRALLGNERCDPHGQAAARRLVSTFGRRLLGHRNSTTLCYLFPTAETLAKADLEPIRITRRQMEAVKDLAQSVLSRESEPDVSDTEGGKVSMLDIIAEHDRSLVDYVALRALHDTDAFPLEAPPGRGTVSSRESSSVELQRTASDWSPWRGYAAVYLWESQGR